MAEVFTIEKAIIAAQHDTFHGEVITGKAGAVASGADIDTATNAVTGQVQTTLPKVLRDVGFKPASFNFVTGGTLGIADADKCIYNPAPAGDDNWYSWGGALPHTVAPGTDPVVVAGYVPRTDVVLRGEMASSSGASIIGTMSGNTVQDIVDKMGKNMSVNIACPVSYGTQSSAVTISRRQRRTDNHVWFLGDSHSWGEGSPEYVSVSVLDPASYSVHSAMLGNRGFVAQSIEKILRARGWNPALYHFANIRIGGADITGSYGNAVPGLDPENTKSAKLLFGKATSTTSNLASSRTRSCDSFYRPICFSDTYSVTNYREKLAVGRFSSVVTTVTHESVSSFYTDTKYHYFVLPVNGSLAGGEAGFTDVVSDGGAVIATRSNSTGGTFIISIQAMSVPYWMSAGSNVFLPGYGLIKIYQYYPNGSIEIRDPSGAVPNAAIMKYFRHGIMLFPGDYINRAVLSVDVAANHSRAYIAVVTGPTRGKLRVYSTDSISSGGSSDPYITTATIKKQLNSYASTNQNPYEFNAWSMKQDGSFNTNDTSITIASAYVEIECNTASEEEVIYVVDFGGKATGRLFIESVESNKSIALRGVVFDNNYAVNLACGGHTVGAWLGEESSFSGETRDHLNDWLTYTPARPSSVVVQVPFVNEYLKQTPIATFKSRLQSLTSRINLHMPNGQNKIGTSYVFYTTLRNREIAFLGAGQSQITYDMYVQAAREFCSDNGHEFVDIESRLIDFVKIAGMPFERLYINSNHPSDFSNMIIADELSAHVMSIG